MPEPTQIDYEAERREANWEFLCARMRHAHQEEVAAIFLEQVEHALSEPTCTMLRERVFALPPHNPHDCRALATLSFSQDELLHLGLLLAELMARAWLEVAERES